MSHFGRSGPPDIKDTYSLLVLNITFRTTADDLFPLFDKYGKVVDVFIPRDRRTGDSRGFAFVRYKYQDEAQKAVDKLDGWCSWIFFFSCLTFSLSHSEFTYRVPQMQEEFHKGRIEEPAYRSKGRSRSRSPRSSDRDRDYRRRSRSRSRSRDRSDREHRRGRDREYRSKSRSRSPSHSRSPARDRGRDKYSDEGRKRSRYSESASPVPRSPSPKNSPGGSPRNHRDRSLTPKSASPDARDYSRSPPRHSDAEV
ncbi:hypothetical protein M569_11334, partial [Genlisea aurea]